MHVMCQERQLSKVNGLRVSMTGEVYSAGKDLMKKTDSLSKFCFSKYLKLGACGWRSYPKKP